MVLTIVTDLAREEDRALDEYIRQVVKGCNMSISDKWSRVAKQVYQTNGQGLQCEYIRQVVNSGNISTSGRW